MSGNIQRNRFFDQNRQVENNRMAEEQIHQLQELISQMQNDYQNQIQQLQQQINQQQDIIRQQQLIQQQQAEQQPIRRQPLFSLTTEQLLNHFRHLQAFNGKDTYTLQEFIRSVENATALCNNNEPLLNYAMQIIFNDKIQGEAKKCIQRLGNNLTWETAKAELKQHFRPKEDYVELINKCRNIKVSTLRELFDIAKHTNYLLNELYDFDDNKPVIYNPENNDRYLVGIVSEKIDNLIRGYIEPNSTLIEIYNKFADLKLLDDERAVHKLHKRNFNISINNNNKRINQTNYSNRQSNIELTRPNNSFRYNSNRQQENFRQNSGQFRNNNFQQFNYPRQNSGQFRNNNFQQQNNQRQNSGQFRNNRENLNNNFQINPFQNLNQRHDPMEIDNILQQINSIQQQLMNSQSESNLQNTQQINNVEKEDVNFIKEPRDVNYQ